MNHEESQNQPDHDHGDDLTREEVLSWEPT